MGGGGASAGGGAEEGGGTLASVKHVVLSFLQGGEQSVGLSARGTQGVSFTIATHSASCSLHPPGVSGEGGRQHLGGGGSTLAHFINVNT